MNKNRRTSATKPRKNMPCGRYLISGVGKRGVGKSERKPAGFVGGEATGPHVGREHSAPSGKGEKRRVGGAWGFRMLDTAGRAKTLETPSHHRGSPARQHLPLPGKGGRREGEGQERG